MSEIIGVLTPTQSNLVYLAYGVAILALPFVILVQLVIGRHWKLLAAYAAAGVLAVLALSISGRGIAAPQWHFDLGDRLDTQLSQFLDDPRWIAHAGRGAHRVRALAVAAAAPVLVGAAAGVRADPPVRQRRRPGPLTAGPGRRLVRRRAGGVGGRHPRPGGPARRRGAGADPARFRGLGARGRPPAPDPARWCWRAIPDPDSTAVVELYGPNQRSGGALRQLWRKFRLRTDETAPLQTSMRRAVEHRALMAIAIGDLGLSNTSSMTVAALDRGWTLYARKPRPRDPARARMPPRCADVWQALRILHESQISHGDLRCGEITVHDGRGAVRRIRQRRIRRHRRAAAVRHRPAVGDHLGDVRPGLGGVRGDRRVRPRHRA